MGYAVATQWYTRPESFATGDVPQPSRAPNSSAAVPLRSKDLILRAMNIVLTSSKDQGSADTADSAAQANAHTASHSMLRHRADRACHESTYCPGWECRH